MADAFEGQVSVISPGMRHFEITPSDSAALDPRPRVLFCAVAGTALVEDEAGTVLQYALQAGDRIEFRGVRLRVGSTGTWYGWV